MRFSTVFLILVVASFVSSCEPADITLAPERRTYVVDLDQPFVINLALSADREVDLNVFDDPHNTFMVGSMSHRVIDEKEMYLAYRKGDLRSVRISPQRLAHYEVTGVLRMCKDISRYCLDFGPGPLGRVPANIGDTVRLHIFMFDESVYLDSDDPIAVADVQIRLTHSSTNK